MRTVARHAAVALLILAGSACSSHTASPPGALACAPQNTRYCRAAVGDLVDTTLAELHPTQPSLGYDEVFYRLGRYTRGKDTPSKLFDDWCAANGQRGVKFAKPGAMVSDPASFTCAVAVGAETAGTIASMKTAVIGPGGQLYLTDGHHTLTAFWEVPGGGPNTHVRLKITSNLSNLAPDAFWHAMQTNGWTWLRDVNGNPVTPDQLPANLGLNQFGNDKYRGVLFFVRDIGYAQDDDSPAFQEFHWGQWLRGQTDPGLRLETFDLNSLGSYLTLVGNVAKAIVALPDTADIGNGRNAHELGKLGAFGQKAFDALSQPYSAAKPGKLAYAILYKTAH